jgi:hypothetical protein
MYKGGRGDASWHGARQGMNSAGLISIISGEKGRT